MATEKILNTRIQLKYDSLQNWTTANTLLKAGEVAVAYLPPKGTGEAPAAVSEAVLMKVGPGNFNDLPFVSALAADVYAWAKEASLTINKEGTGNVVSGIEWDATANGGKGGIKFTTASVATSEGLATLQAEVDAVEKDIADNRAAWVKDDNTTYTFAKSTDGKGITITPSEGAANTITFAFLTQAEIEALNYLVAADITTGSANGTIAVEGTDVAVKGLGSAAFTEAAAYATAAQGTKADNAAVKTEVDASLALKADKSVVDAMYTNSKIDELLATKQNTIPANTYDAYGAAAAVLGESTDPATANTVYGAKAAAAAAQSDATIAKTKIETFLGTVTPDGSADIIDTLTEINNYVGEHGEEFAALSGKVTNIENGTTATTAGDLTAELEAEIKGYTVANATNAANAAQLGGQDPAYYATAASVTDITKDNGTIDTKVKAAIDAEVERADAAYATAAQGAKADSAVQSVSVGVVDPTDAPAIALTVDGTQANVEFVGSNGITVEGDNAGTGSATDKLTFSIDYTKVATAAQGALADTALQSVTGNVDIAPVVDGTTLKFYEIGLSKDGKTVKLEKLAADSSVDLAGIKVNSAVQADTVADHAIGAHQTKACSDYAGADAEVWVFNCGSATVNV